MARITQITVDMLLCAEPLFAAPRAFFDGFRSIDLLSLVGVGSDSPNIALAVTSVGSVKL